MMWWSFDTRYIVVGEPMMQLTAQAIWCIVLLAVLAAPEPSSVSAGSPPAAEPALAASRAQTLELVGHIGGPTVALAAQGSTLYVGVGPRVIIRDASDPTVSPVLGQSAPLPSVVHSIAVAGDYAYVAAGAALFMLNVSDPTRPALVDWIALPAEAVSLAVAGRYVYVAVGEQGLRIIDVASGPRPIEVGEYRPSGATYHVAVQDRHVFLTARPAPALHMPSQDYGMRVLDVGDPNRPREVAFFALPDMPVGLSLTGGRAFVTDLGGLRVVDVANPTLPTMRGALAEAYSAGDGGGTMAAADGLLFLAAGASGIRIVDVSDPAHPVPLASQRMETGPGCCTDSANGVAVVGTHVYATDRNHGLRAVDVSEPSRPRVAASWPGSEGTYHVALVADTAYVAAGRSGAHAIDVSDPASPRLLWSSGSGSPASRIAVVGSYLYLFGFDGALEAWDVSEPVQPARVASTRVGNSVMDVAAVDSVAYTAELEGLRILDIADPPRLRTLALARTGFLTPRVTTVAVSGSTAYLGTWDGLYLLDVSDPLAPRQLGIYRQQRGGSGLAADGPHAYLMDQAGRLQVLDVADPSAPVALGATDPIPVRRPEPGRPFTPSLALDGGSQRVAVADGYAYIADGRTDGGLRIVDVSDPRRPTQVGFLQTPGAASGVVVAGPYAYVADWLAGLFVFRRSDR